MAFELDRGSKLPGGGHSAEPDGAGAQDQYPHPGDHAGAVDAVESNGQWLDQMGLVQCQSGGKWDGTRGMDPDLIGQAAVEADAIHVPEGIPALLGGPGQASVTGAAVHNREYGHCRSVVESPTELVAKYGPGRAE